MTRMHDPIGCSKLAEFHFTAWVKRRFHGDDASIPRGQYREPDHILELHGAVQLERLIHFLEDAMLADRRVYGVLISALPEDE